MSIFERIELERHRRDIYLCKPVSQPDATGFSEDVPDAIEPIPSAFSTDYSGEHSAPSKTAPIAKLVGRIAPQKPALPEDQKR